MRPRDARGDYLGGRFVPVTEAQASGVLVRSSPREFADVVARVPFRAEAVDEGVQQARRASPAWARASIPERSKLLRSLKAALSARADELVALLVREIGKPVWEARTEVAALSAKIDITLDEGLSLVAPRQMAPAQSYAFRPLGVAGVLGPFNFPLHLVHGHVVPLLATGNTVVVKPSELAPALGQVYAECFDQAGFPPGVFNLIQGDGAQGARLAAHPDLDGVMLTGSYATGQAIKRATFDQPHKLLALELGGRNPAIVLSDADLDKAVHDVMWGAFVTAGQRCSGTAVALVARGILEPFLARLLGALDEMKVGDPRAEGIFMGPLITEAARQRFLAALAQAEQDGAEALRPARELGGQPQGAYVSPSVHLVRQPGQRSYETEELFGPDLAIEPIDDLEQAMVRANQSPYGLSASVFTASDQAFEAALHGLRYGCINRNAPTCGASSRLPFGGLRKSGNYRPAGLFSTLYCTYPVASLRGGDVLDETAQSPGLSLVLDKLAPLVGRR